MKGYKLEAAMKKMEAGWILTDPSQAQARHDQCSGLITKARDNIKTLAWALKNQDKRVVMIEKKIKEHDKALQRARNLIKSLQG